MGNITFDPAYAIAAFIGLIVWFSRLESKTNRNEKDIEKMDAKQSAFESKIIEDLSEVKEALARIEGAFSGQQKREHK